MLASGGVGAFHGGSRNCWYEYLPQESAKGAKQDGRAAQNRVAKPPMVRSFMV